MQQEIVVTNALDPIKRLAQLIVCRLLLATPISCSRKGVVILIRGFDHLQTEICMSKAPILRWSIGAPFLTKYALHTTFNQHASFDT
jgi:hypothetical protein